MPNNEQYLDQKGSPAAGANNKFSSQRRSIMPFYIGTFFYWMAMYLYMPVFSVYAQSLGASLTIVGIIVAVYALPQFLLRIPVGIWADSLGKQKPLMVLGGIMLLAGSVGLAISPGPLFLGISRFLIGVGAAGLVVFPIYLMTLTSKEKIDQAMGMMNFIVGAALVSATLLGGIIADNFGEQTAFIGSAILALISILVMMLMKEISVSPHKTRAWRDFGQVGRKPLLIVVSVMGLIIFFGDFSSVWGFLPVYAVNIGASDTELGILSMLTVGGGMAGSLLIAPMIKYWGHFVTIVVSALLFGVTLVLIPFTRSILLLDVFLLIHGIGYGVLSTQFMILCVYNISPEKRATAMGFYQAIYAGGMLAGPLIAGVLSDYYGLPVVFYLGGALCLVIIGLAFLPYLPMGHQTVKEES